MAGDSDLSPLIAIDVFQLYPWHFKQYVCKHKGFLDLASCHLVWETSLITIRCQSMGSRWELCVLGPGMCFSFCLNMSIYSLTHSFPLGKKMWTISLWEKIGCVKVRILPGSRLYVVGQKSPSGKQLYFVPHIRVIEANIPGAPRPVFQVLSTRPNITVTIYVVLPAFMCIVDWNRN